MIFFNNIFRSKHVIIFIIVLVLATFLLLKWMDFNHEPSKNSDAYISIPSETESCKNCHQHSTGFSEFHNPEIIGCVSCHLGNGATEDKAEAHENMVRIPGNLSNAEKTCGKCHVDELHKITHSLMTTNSGIVAIDKFIFGESGSPDLAYHIKDLQFTGADKHLRDLCANCHLGAEKSEFGAINQLSRGGGCNACHLNYSENAVSDLTNYLSSDKKILPKAHPSVDIFVKNEHCFGCHSRSNRISTNYEGWHETLLEDKDILNKQGFRTLEDGRIYTYKGEDVHHAKGMLCIDCHSSHEVMGDGKDYLHEENAVKIQCSDCHFDKKPNTTTYEQLDTESKLVWLHRKYLHEDKPILITEKDDNPMVNTYLDSSKAFLISKNDGKIHSIKPQSEICSRDAAHQKVSCSACHAQWSPRCIGCHNSFSKDDPKGYDLLDKKEVIGQWIEYVYEFNADKPSLGVRENKDGRKIEPAIPGMILTIDHQSFSENEKDKTSFHRLYAPNSPHTIVKEARDCKSCHSNPAAIGYGNGTLKYVISNGVGEWFFKPQYDKNPNDNLPEDAWIPFLTKQKAAIVSTRTDFRPFNLKEQKRILLVGACLTCHSENSKVMKNTLLKGLNPVLLQVNEQCILPTKK